MEEIPTPGLAVPYAAPMFANTNALVTPMNHGGNDAIVIRREIYVYYHVFYCYEIQS